MAPTAKPHTGIYMICNTKNGRFYIGSAMRFSHRWGTHLRDLKNNRHHSKFMQRDWNKNGSEHFEFSILMYCEPNELIKNEQTYLDSMKPVYNSAPVAGSQLGYKHREESRAKMSLSRPKDFSPMTGKQHTAETKAKISATKTGVKFGPYSKERCKKLRESQKGRVISPDHRAKISATLSGHKQSKEQIAKRLANMPKGHYERMAISKQKYSTDDVLKVRRLIEQGISYRSIESITGVNRSTVADIKIGRRYKGVE